MTEAKQRHPGGRPPAYADPESMQEAIDRYFNSCKMPLKDKDGNIQFDNNGEIIEVIHKPLTITGLALALGFASRQSLIDYAVKGEFADTVTRAKLIIEDYAVNRTFDKDGVQGAKFNLANNFGWSERVEVEQTGNPALLQLVNVTGLSQLDSADLQSLEQILSKTTLPEPPEE